MRLNKECVRDMLLYIEEHCVYYNDPKHGHLLHSVTFKEINESDIFSQYTYDEKYYTMQKLFEGRYVNGYVVPKGAYGRFTYACVDSLSLGGHDLLDNIRPKEVWEETKGILHKAGDFSLTIMTKVAGDIMAEYTKRMLNLK